MRGERTGETGRRNRRASRLRGVMVLIPALLPCWAAASDLGPVFRTISVNEGLPDRRVEAIVQDAHGYIWIGTRGGLVRHEGERMRFIAADPDSPDPLPGRNIMSLMAHSDGTVWAAVENRGVVQIGPDLGLRRHLEPERHGGPLPAGNVWSMAEDCDGRIWMAFMRGGVAVHDPESGTVRAYPQARSAGFDPDGFQVHVEVDSACHVWLAQTGQVSVRRAGEERFRAVHVLKEGRFALTLAEADGRILFNEGGILQDLGPTASAPDRVPAPIAEVDGVITGIAADPASDELVIASTAGLYRKSPGAGGAMRGIRHVRGLANGLPSDSVDSLTVDREGGLWLTTTRSGAAYLPPGSAAFERFQPVPGREEPSDLTVDPVMSLALDERAGGFWVGGLRGELQFLPLGADAGDLPVIPEGAREALSGSAVLGIMPEGERLYVISQTTALSIDLGPDGGHRLLARREEVDAGTLGFLRRKDDGQLWIATQDVGLFLLDEATGRRRHFHPAGEGPLHLPEPAPLDLRIGPDGHWWLLGSGGLYRWEGQAGFVRFAEAQAEPFAAAAWLGDDLWLATDRSLQLWRNRGRGLEAVEEIDLEDRLPPGRTIQIVPDRLGQLWLMRTSGLSLYRIDQDRVRHLSQRDGLAAIEFGENTAVSLPNGRLAFAGRGGIVTVDPARVSSVAVAPLVHVERLQAGDRVVEVGPGAAPGVELGHDRDTLFIDFLATTYLAPGRTRYRVRLEGWDSDWIELIGQTRHHYSNLPPGSYRFRVQAAAPDGPWSEDGALLPLTIRRPPWLGGWALATYALLAVTGASAGWRGYRRARQRRREVHEARQKRALAEEQRKIISRLNLSLEPLALAETIALEIVQVTGGRVAWLGYVDEHLPRELACSEPQRGAMTREQWRRRLDAVDRVNDLALTLRVAGREVARVLVDGPVSDLDGEGRERLRLLEEMAGQALHNAMLLQRVRALADRAEQASNAKSEFLATMSHEIRTPLHGVLGMVELLYETETEPRQQDILDTLRHSGLQLQRIIDDVLDISRIEAGRMPLDPQPFDLAAMLEQVVDLHAPNAARKGLDLRLRMAVDLPLAATGDSDRLSQVLGNLLSNAVKFTECGGIELSAAVGRDGWLVVVVSDSGPGIGAADRERLFEPFTQLDASITRSYSGSGLGLAICRRLVDAMGGTLDLLPGCQRGSRFRVRLPVLGTADRPPAGGLSKLLEGQVVAAALPAPSMRVLRALARRWGVGVVDVRSAPRSCELLLVDPGAGTAADVQRLDRWRQQAGALAWLQSPFPMRSGSPPALPRDAHFLRWPLVESRLVGLLFDLRIGGRDVWPGE